MTSPALNRQRKRLFDQQRGRCHWCGREMIAPGKHKTPNGTPLPALTCTIDHLYDAFHPKRQKDVPSPKVAACWECNNRRCADRMASLPLHVIKAKQRGVTIPVLEVPGPPKNLPGAMPSDLPKPAKGG